MPLARPAAVDPPPAANTITIARADLTGMDPAAAYEAVLGALDAGIIAATSAAGMIDQAVIDDGVAVLAYSRKVAAEHEPFRLVSNDPDKPAPEGVWCMAHNGDPRSTWPCPTYREAAGVIADGLAAVVLR